MIDVHGLDLTPEDIDILQNPLVGGVILFARNYRDKAQLTRLCARIRQACPRPVLLAVDQEGGRVQRFGAPDFTRIPAMQRYGALYDTNPDAARARAVDTGRLMAAELIEAGVDFSFTPVLDLNYGVSHVIGDRAFHRDPAVVSLLATCLVDGLRQGGMAAVAKHYPGHGGVVVDSHVGLPVDNRDVSTIIDQDLAPFKRLIAAGVAGIMPAHVIYAQADAQAAGFSHYWLQTQLRGELQFDGAIFSDDLSMQAAHAAGGVVERAIAAAEAGCDMLLLCNDRASVKTLLSDYRDTTATPQRQGRLHAMQARPLNTASPPDCWQAIRKQITKL